MKKEKKLTWIKRRSRNSAEKGRGTNQVKVKIKLRADHLIGSFLDVSLKKYKNQIEMRKDRHKPGRKGVAGNSGRSFSRPN